MCSSYFEESCGSVQPSVVDTLLFLFIDNTVIISVAKNKKAIKLANKKINKEVLNLIETVDTIKYWKKRKFS